MVTCGEGKSVLDCIEKKHSFMTVVLISHRTDLPAVDGMIAGMVAAERGAPVAHLVTGGAGLGRYDGTQHVLESGDLAANGLFWAEWAGNRFVEPAMQAPLVPRHPAPIVVVPINPAIPAQTKAAERIAHHAGLVGRAVEEFEVSEEGDVFALREKGGNGIAAMWTRDAFGRPQRTDLNPIAPDKWVRLLVVGDESLLRDTYPANLAVLGDAADALGLGVDLSFWDPRDDRESGLEARIAGVDGVLLPGGSDMEQVPGQIEVAQRTIRRDLPTVGLCLGMQAMATAVAREIGGFNDANMEEADPDAQTKTFIRMHDAAGQPQFRLGLRRQRIQPGTKLSEIFGGADHAQVHCNHRYVLQPEMHGTLKRAGMMVSGMQQDRDLADAIEVPSLRFYVGMQGHPELMARRGKPHPLVLAFLREVAA